MRHIIITSLIMLLSVAAQAQTPRAFSPRPAQPGSLRAITATTAQRTAVQRRAVTSVTQLAGSYIHVFSDFNGLGTNGASPTIQALGSDSIIISGFWEEGTKLRAKVDLTTGTITIPNQKAGTRSDYGDYNFAAADADGVQDDAATQVTATVAADGSIHFQGNWLLAVASGNYAGGIFAAGQGSVLKPANGKMTALNFDTDKTIAWNVCVTQPAPDSVMIENFANRGKTLKINLFCDSTVSVPSQVAYDGVDFSGPFYSSSAHWIDRYFTSPAITGKVTDKQITWDNWGLLSTKRYYIGKFENCHITWADSAATFAVPVIDSLALQGTGTEANPYLITSWNDLLYVSKQVASDTQLNSYTGKYFRVTRDIEGGKFTPIGSDFHYHIFNGQFDGQGHTISNVNVTTGTKGFAGLFGSIGKQAVVKNLTLKDISISSGFYYNGCLAAWADGSKIKNVHVTGDVWTEGQYTAGLLGAGINQAQLDSCSYVGTVYSSAGNVGGIASYLAGTLSHAHASGTVYMMGREAGMSGGGIVGSITGSKSAVSDAYFNGSVYSNITDGSRHGNLIGGIAGSAADGAKLQRVFSNANVYGNRDCIGGIVGRLTGEVRDAYASGYVCDTMPNHWGTVSGTGGIVGFVQGYADLKGKRHNSVLHNVLFTGALDVNRTGYNPATDYKEIVGLNNAPQYVTFENVYFDSQIMNLHTQRFGVPTDSLVSAAGPKGFDAAVWTFTEGFYPRLKGMDDNVPARVSASAFHFAPTDNCNHVTSDIALRSLDGVSKFIYRGGNQSNTGNGGAISGDTYKVGTAFAADTLFIAAADGVSATPHSIIIKVAPAFLTGQGTEQSPYLITNKADLLALAKAVNEEHQYYDGTWFRQTADIDLQADSAFVGIATGKDELGADLRFQGHYDGDGHTISGLSLKGTGTGFISTLGEGGSLTGLTIAADAQLQFADYGGAFIGHNYGTATHLVNLAAVSGKAQVGGITGVAEGPSVISQVLNAGAVTATEAKAGGIAGAASGSITEAQNTGRIIAATEAGGIAGWASVATISDALNAGSISAKKFVGGIVGHNNDTQTDIWSGLDITTKNKISRVVNYGTQLCADATTTGAILGDAIATGGSLSGAFFDSQVPGIDAVAGDSAVGAKGLLTSQITAPDSTMKATLPASMWSFAQGTYPVLSAFAAQPAAVAASKAIMSIPAGQSATSLKQSVPLAKVEGLTWKLQADSVLHVQADSLLIPAVVPTLTADTLTATCGQYEKVIAVAALPAVPFDGTGTEADPYQIKTTADWNALDTYVTATHNSMRGLWVKIMNDIDFTGVPLVMLATGATPFNGTLLGDGHTISGVDLTAKGSNVALISHLGTYGTVRDLTVRGKVSNPGDYDYFGLIFGTAEGTVINCVSQGAVHSHGGNVGGIAGQAGGTARFIGCRNEAVVSSDNIHAGGIVGTAQSGVQFTDCVNADSISCTSGRGAGGMLGYAEAKASFIHCHNQAPITSAGSFVGGILGWAYGKRTDTLTFVGCTNVAPISAKNDVAGIMGGTNINSAIEYKNTIIADSCSNTAAITSSGYESEPGTAGLFAMLTPGSRLTNSWNSGDISGTMDSRYQRYAQYYGGVVGMTFTTGSYTGTHYPIQVTNCYNTGSVSGVNGVGGVIGEFDSSVHVDSCYNTGAVTASASSAGGISGYVSGHWGHVKNCWNAGTVAAQSSAGGLVGGGTKIFHISNSFNMGDVTAQNNMAGGLAGENYTFVTNSFNVGTVTAKGYAAGLIASTGFKNNLTGNTAFYHSYNAGQVIATADSTYSGNLVGTKTRWRSAWGNVAQDTRYVTDWGTYAGDDSIAAPVTMAQLAAMSKAQRARRVGMNFGIDYAEDPDSLGYDWGDQYSLPMIPGFTAGDAQHCAVAAVVLNPADRYDHVSHTFHIGLPEGVTWSTDNPNLLISGDSVTIVKAFDGEAILTASCGEFSRQWKLKFVDPSGVTDALTDAQVVAERYYSISGMQLREKPQGVPYILVRTYSNGTTRSLKAIDR